MTKIIIIGAGAMGSAFTIPCIENGNDVTYSFSTDPKLKGAPSNHEIPIREVRLSSGAEFIVVVCGSIMTMPGLPRVPAANNIKLNKKGDVEGLF